MYLQWRRTTRTGLRFTQENRLSLYERTSLFKTYCSTVVPGFLQTPAYAHALLSTITRFQETPDDVDDAVQARMRRNRMLHSSLHRFVLLVEESVLRYQIGTAETMTGQLDHLTRVTGHSSVTFGVIPFAAPDRPIWTLEAFTVFDNSRVHVELLSAQVTVTAPSEIALYVRAFEKLAAMAVYGDNARSLIAAAAEALR
jgi:Domain of unknown function (DUF5753)